MANLNRVTLIGTLTRDPELKYTPKGTALADIGMAVNRAYMTEAGEKREEATFIDIKFWGKLAEIIGEHMRKGKQMYVEGRLSLDTWTDKATGKPRSKLVIVGESFQFLGARDGGERAGREEVRGDRGNDPAENGRPARIGTPTPSTKRTPPKDPDLDAEGDDIPF